MSQLRLKKQSGTAALLVAFWQSVRNLLQVEFGSFLEIGDRLFDGFPLGRCACLRIERAISAFLCGDDKRIQDLGSKVTLLRREARESVTWHLARG